LTISEHKLRQIKLLHTAIWAVMAVAILSVPWAGWFRHFRWAFGLSLFILGECLVLALNHGRCPLTDIAARYSPDRTGRNDDRNQDRADNFDIYLPLRLARHNKRIFGFLFVAGEVVVLVRWRFGL
jgi:hypothetical protein